MAGDPQTDRWAAGRLTPAHLDAVLSRLRSLPACPVVAADLLELLVEALDTSPGNRQRLDGEIVRLVRCDPALTARVLSLAAGSPTAPATAAQAVGQLGIDALCGEALTLTVIPAAEDRTDEPSVTPQGLREHCLAVACAGEMIAGRLAGRIDPAEAFTCGLLHDLGKLAMDACMPKSFRRAVAEAAAGGGDVSECERRVVGADHATIGRRLAEMWRLPQQVAEVIWLHHHPADALPPAVVSAAMIRAVALADAIAYGEQGSDQLAELLDLPAGAVEEVRGRLADEVRRARPVASGSAAAAMQKFRRAQKSLAARLAEANRQLRAGRGDLSLRADAFAQLRRFADALGEQSTVAEALISLAALAAEVTGVQPSADRSVVAYSIGRVGESIQAACLDGGDAPSCRELGVLTDAPGAGADPANLTLPAVAELLGPEQISEWIDVAAYAHLPLLCAGRWVGGVLLPADACAGDRQRVLQSAAAAAAMALAIVQGRCRAVLLGEQLAQASQALSASREALADARTLSAIGEMATGAAHELNNPLAVISGRAQLMRDKAASDEEGKVWATIAEQSQRISDIITELMDFASPPQPAPAEIDVARLLESAAKEFSSSAHPQAAAVRVDIDTGEDTPPAWADAAQVREAVVEAISNAATASNGKCRIRLAARAGDDPEAVLITVADDGPGIDGETLAKAFTPFFSVQRAGRRKGLGLPRARRYVESNAGKIWLTSSRGQGTCLHIQLPRA